MEDDPYNYCSVCNEPIWSLGETCNKCEDKLNGPPKPSELTQLRARVKELEAIEADLQVSLNRYQMDWANHTARIRELEEAMPDAEFIAGVANYLKNLRTHTSEIWSDMLLKSSDRIEKVMRKEGNE